MKKNFEEVLSELVGQPVDMDFKGCFEKNGIDNEIILTMMLCKHLAAINDTLESIDTHLSEISGSLECIEDNLDGCISQIGRSKFICVTGNITSY